MKRTRAEMKAQARVALRRNYWRIVLVSLIMLLLASGGNIGSSAASGVSSAVSDSDDYDDYYYYSDGYEDYNYAATAYQPSDGEGNPSAALSSNSFEEDILGLTSLVLPSLSIGILIVVCIILLAVVVIALALDIFAFAPLRVGAHRFFLVSQQEKARIGELTWAFDQNYRHTVKTMFLLNLKVLLWSLLFIIPGIVKSYEYAAVPYLLAECPEMDSWEVFAASRDLMDGNKGRAFVLDLSFLLWGIASACTLGLLGIFYVNPYQHLTKAAFYQAICQEKAAEQFPPEYPSQVPQEYPPQWGTDGYPDDMSE